MKTESLENQIKREYVCVSCGRRYHLPRHRIKCPSCGGVLRTIEVIEK